MDHSHQDWPFFRSTIELLDMVLAKTNKGISSYYESLLVPDELQVRGQQMPCYFHSTVRILVD